MTTVANVADDNTGKILLPAWARVIIALVVASFVGLAWLGVRFADVIVKLSDDAKNPLRMPKVAAQVGQFPDPLPPGYVYDLAYDFYVQSVVVVKHNPDGQTIMFLLDKGSYDEDPKEFLEKALDIRGQGIPRITTVQAKGKIEIAGCTMPYIVGGFKDPKERDVQGMIACLTVKDKHKTILIYALQPFGSPYNQNVTLDLLKSIKSF